MVWLVIGFALANWPFFTERQFLVRKPAAGEKSFGFRLLELLVGYGLVILVGIGLETNMGAVASQTWNFYAIVALLFLVMAYPGFVWRYLRRRVS
ncbi:MAG: hypothetical protein RL483_343 [Pseudomonadota bacterium]|jgi:hypothetical protein